MRYDLHHDCVRRYGAVWPPATVRARVDRVIVRTHRRRSRGQPAAKRTIGDIVVFAGYCRDRKAADRALPATVYDREVIVAPGPIGGASEFVTKADDERPVAAERECTCIRAIGSRRATTASAAPSPGRQRSCPAPVTVLAARRAADHGCVDNRSGSSQGRRRCDLSG